MEQEDDTSTYQNTLCSNMDTFKNKDKNSKDKINIQELQQQQHDILNESSRQFQQKNNEITLDAKNLEQIRMKAVSMSLPLLTALCSDKSLIRCLSKRDDTNKQAS